MTGGADFYAVLRQLQEGCGLTRAVLARRVNYSRSQLYQILDGGIRRPPEWDRVVEPLLRACTGDDEHAVDYWRRRHGELVEVYEACRRSQPDGTPTLQAVPARVVPAQLPADVDVFTGRTAELSVLDSLLAGGTRTATPGPGRNPSFEGALQRALQTAWDRRLSRRPVLLVLLGSDLGMMSLLSTYGRPLYGRAREMVLDPLTPMTLPSCST